MAKENLRSRAEKYDEIARDKDKRSARSKAGPTYAEVSKWYEKAGDVWAKIKDRRAVERAIDDYKLAKEHARSKEIEGRIRDKIRDLSLMPRRGLEWYFSVLSLIGLVGALSFSIFSLTGHVIGGLTENNSRLIGVFLFIISLVFVFLYFRIKNKIIKRG